MRTIDSNILSEQIKALRIPSTQALIYDSLLRLVTYQSMTLSAYPSTVSDNVPLALLDADITDVGNVGIAYTTGSSIKKYTCTDETWSSAAEDFSVSSPLHRPSVFGTDVFWIDSSGNIKKNTSTFKALGASGNYAVAAVSATEVYVLEQTAVDDTTALILSLHTSVASDTMPESILMPDDYSEYAITWFDAVSLDSDTDVIVINTETQGRPKVIIRKNDVFGDPIEMIPVDIVDNYSYLRIGWIKLYNGVLYATGELGRSGSSGRHPQSMGVVLRSNDGEHWTMDRYRYLGQTPERSPLIMLDGYGYVIRDGEVERAYLTPVFGLESGDITPGHVVIQVDDDIMGWGRSEANHGDSGSLNMSLSDEDNKYTDPVSSSYIKPGYMLVLYAGFEIGGTPYLDQLNVYTIDTIQHSISNGSDSVILQCREWAYANLKDTQFDQDWQWLSQTKHFDDCSRADGMYAITGGYVDVATPDNEEKAVLACDTITDTNGVIQFQTKNKNSLVQATTPFEARNGFVSVMFKTSAAQSFTYGGSFTVTNFGAGCGVAYISDDENCIIVFYNVVDQDLYILEMVDGVVTVLDSVSASSFGQTANDYFEVVCHRKENLLSVVLNNYVISETGVQETVSLDAEVSMITDAFGICGSHGAYILYPDPAMDYDSDNLCMCIPDSVYDLNNSFTYYYEDMDAYWTDEPDWSMPYLTTIKNKILTLNGSIQAGCGNACDDDTRTRAIHTDALYVTGSGYFKIDFDAIYGGAYNDIVSYFTTHSIMYIYLYDSGGSYLTRRKVTSVSYGTDVGAGKTLSVTVNYAGDPISTATMKSFYFVATARVYQVPSSTTTITSIEVNSDGGIDVEEFSAFDVETDKSTEWVLKDIAHKAGILDYVTKNDIDTTFTTNYWATPELADLNTVITLPTALTGSEYLALYLGMSAKSIATASDLIGIKVNLTADGVGGVTCDAYNTSIGYDWIKTYSHTEPGCDSALNYHVTKMGKYISIWAEHRLIASFAAHSRFMLDEDGYNSYVESGGYFGVYTDVSGTKSVVQDELWSIIGASDSAGIIVDQGTPAIGALQKVIRDSRIKCLPSDAAELKISRFVTRDDLGTAPDRIFSHSESPSNRVPTHIRVVGVEIGEYFDHDAMEEYGVLFHSINVETLGEDAAYDECERVVDDALSYSAGYNDMIAAQLQWEPEDQVTVTFTSLDGKDVDQDCIIDGIETSFSPPAMEAKAKLRKLVT